MIFNSLSILLPQLKNRDNFVLLISPTMKFHTHFRPISSHFSPKRPNMSLFCYLSTSLDEYSISTEVLKILDDTANPIEPALERISHSIRRHIVTSTIQNHSNPLMGFRFFIWATSRDSLRSRVTHDLIIDKLLKEGTFFDLYWEAVEQVKQKNFKIGSDAFLVLVKAYGKLGLVQKALESFGKMSDFECNPDVLTYNAILIVLFNKRVWLLALAVYNQMIKSGCEPNVVTFNILIDGLCKCGEIQSSWNFFYQMREIGISPDKFTYTSFVSALFRANQADKALSVFNDMRRTGCLPDSIAYNTLINGFCKLGMVYEAFELLRDFEKDGFVLGVDGYSCLIDGLFRAKRNDDACSLYKIMIEKKLKPDLVLYATMIHWFVRAEDFKKAIKLFDEMTYRGEVPDIYCYNPLIKGFCDLGLFNKAWSLRCEMLKRGCNPNVYTYTILICGMCRIGLTEEAQQVYTTEMEKHGCFPDVVTLNALIAGLCKAGKLKRADSLFHKLEETRRKSFQDPDSESESLETRVKRLCESRLFLKAYEILLRTTDIAVIPNIKTYGILIDSFLKEGDIERAEKLLKDLYNNGLSPDLVIYDIRINGLCKADKEEDALKVIDEMVKIGYTPSPSAFKLVMICFCRKGMVSKAFDLWLSYLKCLPNRDDEAIKYIEGQFKKGEVAFAVVRLLIKDLELEEFDVDPYTIWLIGLCQAGRVEEALQIYVNLVGRQKDVTAPSCVMLIRGLCKKGYLDFALEVFLYALSKGFSLTIPIRCQLQKYLIRFTRNKTSSR